MEHEEYYVYILQSESSGRFYVGQTQNIEKRLQQHNNPNHKATKTTKKLKGPWKLVYHEPWPTRAEAMAREKQIKKWKSRKSIESLIERSRYPGRTNAYRD